MTQLGANGSAQTAVGFVFQKYNLLPTLTAEDNIRIVQYIAGRNTEFDPAFQEVLRLLGIADRMKHKPRALSGGQQQRVAIARGDREFACDSAGRRAYGQSRQRKLGCRSEADEGPEPPPGADDSDDHARFRCGFLC